MKRDVHLDFFLKVKISFQVSKSAKCTTFQKLLHKFLTRNGIFYHKIRAANPFEIMRIF